MPFCKNKSQLSHDLRHNHRRLIQEAESLLTIVQWLSTHLPECPMLCVQSVLKAVPLYSRGQGGDLLSLWRHCSFSYLALSALCHETTFARQNECRTNWMTWEAFLKTEWNESVSPGWWCLSKDFGRSLCKLPWVFSSGMGGVSSKLDFFIIARSITLNFYKP